MTFNPRLLSYIITHLVSLQHINLSETVNFISANVTLVDQHRIQITEEQECKSNTERSDMHAANLPPHPGFNSLKRYKKTRAATENLCHQIIQITLYLKVIRVSSRMYMRWNSEPELNTACPLRIQLCDHKAQVTVVETMQLF